MLPQAFDLNPRHLRALSEIIGRGSVSAAAGAVGLSQPALTQGVGKLENQLGVQLFERHADGMSATAAGAVLAERAEAAFSHLAKGISTAGRDSARPHLLLTGTQMRAFLALADAGGFTQASSATGLSQPAIHRAVRELEQVCRRPLVERRGRGVVLTSGGNRVARAVRLARLELAAAISEICGGADDGGRLVIGAMPLSRAVLVPRAIARFVTEYPRARVDVVEGAWRELMDPLLDGILDLTVGALRNPPPAGVAQIPLLVDRLAVIARSGHPLSASATPSLAELSAYPWIVGQRGTPLRTQWETLFHETGLPAAPIECGSVMVIREILRASDFLTLLSLDQVSVEIATGILAPLGPQPTQGTRTIGISTREGWRPTPAQSRFVDFLKAIAKTQENQ